MSGTKVSGDIRPATALTFVLASDGITPSAVSNVSINSLLIEATTFKTLWIAVYIASTSTPAGNLVVQGSLDNGTTWTDIVLEANKVYGVSFSSASSNIAYSASAATNVLIPLSDPPPYVRVQVVRASGGATGTKITAAYFMRGV